MADPCNVAEEQRLEVSFVLAGRAEPLVVSLPLLLRGIAGPSRLTRFIERETVREGVRFRLAIPNTSTAHESIETHNSLPSAILVSETASRLKG
jgi:hypothetical protein